MNLAKIPSYKKSIQLMIVIFLASIAAGSLAVFYNHIFIFGTIIARVRFFESREILFVISPVLFLISAWLCRRFAPNASGSGPEHVIEALKKLSDKNSDKDVSEYLSPKILIVKIISSVICIAGGGALGREGPVVQISASLFLLVAQKTKKFLPNFDLRTWIVAGSAAGVAAAFNTPLAGIIFAIEELSRFHFEEKFFGFKTQAFFAVIVAGVTAQFITGSYVLFGFPMLDFKWHINMLLILLLVSVICGFTAWLLKNIITKITKWRNGITGNTWYAIPLISGLVVATVSYFIGQHSFGAGMFTITDTLQSSTAILTFNDSIGRFINIIATSAAGCAGGLLLPALALGAGIGSVSSTLLPLVDARIFVATGMAAFLGALLNAPLTAAVLVLEVTNQRELILPLFMATLVSSWIFNSCSEKSAATLPLRLLSQKIK
jgi:H+/Cl- antiporter ClcA